MSLKKLLLEIATDILFHFTTRRNALSIIKNNEFNTTNVIGSKWDQKFNKKGFYMFSTQRSGNAKLGYAKFRSNVRIVLDGRKLSQRYTVKPIDYMGVPRDPKDSISKGDMMRNVEMEDRVITDESEIPNASSYVSRIDVIFDPNNKKESTYAYNIFKESEGKFDVYFFTEEQRKDFENQRIDKAIQDLDLIDLDIEDQDDEYIESAYQMDEILIYLYFLDKDKYEEGIDILTKDRKINQNYDTYYKEKYSSVEDYVRQDVNDHFDHKLRYIAYPYSEKELETVLSTAFHNNRSSSNQSAKKIIKIFTRAMRQHKLNNLKEVVEFVSLKAQEYYNNK